MPLAAILPFFSTLIGGMAALRLRHRLHPFMPFASGVLVATAIADLLPEAQALVGAGGGLEVGVAACRVGFVAIHEGGGSGGKIRTYDQAVNSRPPHGRY